MSGSVPRGDGVGLIIESFAGVDGDGIGGRASQPRDVLVSRSVPEADAPATLASAPTRSTGTFKLAA